MKFLPAQLYYFLRDRPSRVNVMNLVRFILILAGLVSVYSIIFHYIMAWEGRTEYSWVTGFYWTLTVMSTLGFGDITFNSDLGRIFSTIVLLSGIIFLLVLLPFTFIEFFYAPWTRAQSEARAPSRLPEETRGHVILTNLDSVSAAVIDRLEQFQWPYALLVPEIGEALRLHDRGLKVVVGHLDDPETYRRTRVENAVLVASTANDMVNTNVAYTVREISETVPIITTANSPASVDILQLAGSSHVLQLGEQMGQALARRVIGGDVLAHVIGRFDQLLIAEATVAGTPFVGKRLRDSGLREKVGLSVLGVWERGAFELAGPETVIRSNTVLVLAGTEAQIALYNSLLADFPVTKAPVIIVGGGRVGRATGRALAERGLDYRIVERQSARIRDEAKYVEGDAAELAVLEQAGIMVAPTAVVTTHDDDTNIYLTIYCRRLRPDIQIISRATLERNIATLHRAGADFVLSYASMGANTIMNLLNRGNILMVAEGLDIFSLPTPRALRGRRIAEAEIRHKTGCTVVAIRQAEAIRVNPDPGMVMPAGSELILIGSVAAEKRFLRLFGDASGGTNTAASRLI